MRLVGPETAGGMSGERNLLRTREFIKRVAVSTFLSLREKKSEGMLAQAPASNWARWALSALIKLAAWVDRGQQSRSIRRARDNTGVAGLLIVCSCTVGSESS